MDNINLNEDERIDDLEYKGLKLIQNKNGFCFGVDAVLLSDYAKNIKNLNLIEKIWEQNPIENLKPGYDFILSLSKQLTSDGKGSFSVSSGVGEYIYFATPSRFATPRFSVGGLEGGFALVHTLDFTNASGYMESYNIYKSDIRFHTQ